MIDFRKAMLAATSGLALSSGVALASDLPTKKGPPPAPIATPTPTPTPAIDNTFGGLPNNAWTNASVSALSNGIAAGLMPGYNTDTTINGYSFDVSICNGKCQYSGGDKITTSYRNMNGKGLLYQIGTATAFAGVATFAENQFFDTNPFNAKTLEGAAIAVTATLGTDIGAQFLGAWARAKFAPDSNTTCYQFDTWGQNDVPTTIQNCGMTKAAQEAASKTFGRALLAGGLGLTLSFPLSDGRFSGTPTLAPRL